MCLFMYLFFYVSVYLFVCLCLGLMTFLGSGSNGLYTFHFYMLFQSIIVDKMSALDQTHGVSVIAELMDISELTTTSEM